MDDISNSDLKYAEEQIEEARRRLTSVQERVMTEESYLLGSVNEKRGF
jgi:hypothetical protein